MSAMDEWWNDDVDYDSIPAASECVVKRINAETGEIEVVDVLPALKADMQPGKTLEGMRSQRHATDTTRTVGTVVG